MVETTAAGLQRPGRFRARPRRVQLGFPRVLLRAVRRYPPGFNKLRLVGTLSLQRSTKQDRGHRLGKAIPRLAPLSHPKGEPAVASKIDKINSGCRVQKVRPLSGPGTAP